MVDIMLETRSPNQPFDFEISRFKQTKMGIDFGEIELVHQSAGVPTAVSI